MKRQTLEQLKAHIGERVCLTHRSRDEYLWEYKGVLEEVRDKGVILRFKPPTTGQHGEYDSGTRYFNKSHIVKIVVDGKPFV